MTNNSIFTRVLAILICLVMLAGSLTACLQGVDFENQVGSLPSDNGISVYPSKPEVTVPSTGDKSGNNPTEDPDALFSASTDLGEGSLILGSLANDLMIGGPELGAMLPADVKIEAGASQIALSVKNVENPEVDFGESELVSSLDVHISGIAADNTVPMVVNLGAILEAGLGDTELKFYHHENGTPVLMTRVASVDDFAIHNQYYYNTETGEVTIYVSSFSVFTAVQSTASKWTDQTVADTSWYNANDTEFTLEDVADFLGFRDLVDAGNTFAGKTVILATDIDLSDKPFDPIGFGYWYETNVVEGKDQNTVFMGTFDGGNHTIYNLYENCWELDPDKYTYSTAGAGLFASIKDATIKNIAISGAEIVFECVDMGVLVGYAQGECHFENIVITNANIGNYNRYTGGLVGEVSYGVDNNGDGYSHTFKNITIDSTVTVSGLWGSFGCGMGGVIGGKWGDATVKMENVVSAPVMDVYNDVVSAYQWYAFRGCGMLIGHTEEPYSDGRHSGIATASFLTCQNVKVYYGDWVNYTYYEFENQDNATGRNYPWVRAEAGVYCDAFSNIRYGVPTHNGVKVSDLTEEELKAAATDYTTIVFNQLYGADRGMYGQAEHEGVTVINKNTKTIYIQNNLEWENLKLHYWYKHGEDTWTNIDSNGIALTEENGVYKVVIPAYAFAFKITADGDNESEEFVLANYENNGKVTLGGACEHTNTTTTTVGATCTVAGSTTVTCDDCKVTISVTEIPATGHNHNAVVTNPTCTAAGYTTYTCACGDTYREDGEAALGHKYTNDCDAACDVCGEERTVGEHNYETVVTAPTCTTDGYTTYTCTVCGDSYVDDKVAAAGHTPATAVKENEKASTCTVAGSYDSVVYCSVCKAEISRETVTVAALGHDWSKDPYTCSVCKVAAETVTVYFQNTWLWDDVRLYYSHNGNWTENKLQPEGYDGTYEYYKFELSVHVERFNISGQMNKERDGREGFRDILISEVEVYDEVMISIRALVNDILEVNISQYTAKTLNKYKLLYFKSNNEWYSDGARFAVYAFKGNSNKWYSLTEDNKYKGGIYKLWISTDYDTVIFCRMNGSASANNWDNKWNQTGDLKIPTNGYNFFTLPAGSWNGATTTWSKYTPNYN